MAKNKGKIVACLDIGTSKLVCLIAAIDDKEITIFVNKLRASKMGVMYLNLLQACCSCQGNGVDNNQCKVADMLFSDTNDIIIHMNADYSKVFKADWNLGKSIYIFPIDACLAQGFNVIPIDIRLTQRLDIIPVDAGLR
jgi:hypothetical protein